MTKPLTFGDTFTLPSTGDAVWTIVDQRPTHVADIDVHPFSARAKTEGHVAHYSPETGWFDYGWGLLPELGTLDVSLPRRTAEECEQIRFDSIEEATRWRIGRLADELRLGGVMYLGANAHEVNRPYLAHIAAVTAVTVAGGEPGDDLYRTVYDATLARLSA